MVPKPPSKLAPARFTRVAMRARARAISAGEGSLGTGRPSARAATRARNTPCARSASRTSRSASAMATASLRRRASSSLAVARIRRGLPRDWLMRMTSLSDAPPKRRSAPCMACTARASRYSSEVAPWRT